MTHELIFLPAMLAATLLLDAAIRPRAARIRQWRGIVLHLLIVIGIFGIGLAGSGNVVVAAILATALIALFMIASNAKYAMLGEPVVFSDLALIVAIFRHPRFYFTAISMGERWLLTAGAVVAVLVLVLFFQTALVPHLVGLGLALFAAAASSLLLNSRWWGSALQHPNLDADVARFGLMATLLAYWTRWRQAPDPPPFAPHMGATGRGSGGPQIIVIIQCESFCDPVEITGDERDALPGLSHARSIAAQWGTLAVSGFGAYTMRTEYGVLFGRSEAALGFRRYDPFLTAHGETSYALGSRLKADGFGCTFIHPHDMRFYGRDRLMPAIGFDRIIGDSAFAPVTAGGGRYVDDRTLAAALRDLIDTDTDPSMIYAVTMENHGPWEADDTSSTDGRLAAYLHHLRNSDRMLTDLIDRLSTDDRPSMLVFFGDHRPSIPGVTQPHGARHTPYVMIRFDGDGVPAARNTPGIDLTPDALHHAILASVHPAPFADTTAPPETARRD